MNGITIYEYDALAPARADLVGIDEVNIVPDNVFRWLDAQCLRAADQGTAPWLRWTQRRGCCFALESDPPFALNSDPPILKKKI